ncbi:MAG: hypothetical protein WA510_06920 [Acidobacteriaceae bacterium]
MHSFLIAFAAGVGVLCSLAGWGFLVVKGLRLRIDAGLGFCAAVGLALSACFGGFLDIQHLIRPAIIRGYLLAGVLIFLFAGIAQLQDIRHNLSGAWAYFRRRKFLLVVGSFLILITVVKYAIATSSGTFHVHDDYHAYMVFPVKMMQTGTMGADPFSERRIVSSLGGEAFLDTFSLSLTGQYKNLHLIDSGVAYLILLLLLAEVIVRKGIPGFWALLILLAASMYGAPISNITSVYGGIALLILLFDYFDRTVETPTWNQPLLLAIVFAGLLSMKTNFAPAGGIFFLSFFIVQWLHVPGKGKTIARAALCTVLAFILLLPWMLDSYHSSGTLFYPILGKGFHGSRYGTYLLPTAHLGLNNLLAFLDGISNVVGAILFSLCCLAITGRGRKPHDRLVEIVIIVNLLIDVVAVGIGVGGVQTFRYSFVILFACLLFLLIQELTFFTRPAASSTPLTPASINSLRAVAAIAPAILLAMLLGTAWDTVYLGQKDWEVYALKFAVTGRDIVSPSEVSTYREMQSAVPPGQTLLVRMDKNFLFDFRRNPIYIDDLPGGSSLPPGIPSFKGPDAVANYLLAHGIRYVAYSYRDEANLSRAVYSDRLDPSVNVWLRRGAQIAFDFQDNLVQLGRTRKKLFDNGQMFVLDLASPAQSAAQFMPAN